MYVLDNNDGVVLFPGVDQLASLGHSVELEAQVAGTTVSSYNWITSGISSDASSMTGASTYELTFQWNGNNLTSERVDPITLAVTDTSSHIETYTYDFLIPHGSVASGSGGGGTASWPTSLDPGQQLLSAPRLYQHLRIGPTRPAAAPLEH